MILLITIKMFKNILMHLRYVSLGLVLKYVLCPNGAKHLFYNKLFNTH